MFGWAERDPGRARFAAQGDGGWQSLTAAQFAGRVGAVAAGLVGSGIGPGDRVGLMAATSLEWAVCDFAILDYVLEKYASDIDALYAGPGSAVPPGHR